MRAIGPIVFAVGVSCLLLGVRASPANAAPRLPVLFVHGHGMSGESWGSAIKSLRRAGYADAELRAIDIVPNVQSNVTSAVNNIAPAVEELLREANDAPVTKVNIVAHSMGAFSARWYAAQIAPQRVNALITIAGANHGTDALCKYPEQDGAAEMCPAFARPGDGRAGTVQSTINHTPENRRDETPYGVGADSAGVVRVLPVEDRRIHYFTLRIADDRWIVPSHSALLSGAGGTPAGVRIDGVEETSAGNYLLAPRYGLLRRMRDHCSLLYDDTVLDLLKTLLQHSDRRYFSDVDAP